MGLTSFPGADTVTKDGRTSQFVASGFTETETIHIDVSTNSTLIAYMLIDISDTTNWKHTNTGHINLEWILFEVDPDSSWVGQIKIGFLESVNATDGDFHQIFDIDMERKTALIVENLDFGSHGLDCESNHHFGPIIADSTLFQTDVTIGGPNAPGTPTYASGAGDLVMIIDGDGTNFVDVSITIGYETAA
ncbi:hypothetical protein LCGC14_2942400 [marine sediment metagenome]|uniref:Uncharacterized protein n=1 Tax=marine sediment metagenome TaxID=412755 RepID=A0A0F8XHH5_9ZZZZ